MREALTVVIASVASLAICWGQASDKLDIRDTGDRLIVRAELSAKYWPDGRGTATLDFETTPSDPTIITRSEVPYEIRGHRLTAAIPYRKPALQPVRISIRLSNVNDTNGPNKKPFIGSITVKPQPSSAAPSKAPPPSRLPAATSSVVPSVATPQKPGVEKADQGAMAETPGSEPSSKSDAGASSDTEPKKGAEGSPIPGWLTYANSAALGIALLSGLVYLVWRKMRAVDPLQEFYAGRVYPELMQLKNSIEQVKATSQDAIRQASTVVQGARAALDGPDGIAARIEGVRREADQLVRRSLETTLGPTGDIEQLISLLRDQTKEAREVPAFGAVPLMNREGTGAAAVVNRWLSGGGRDRQELLGLARELGLGARLASHKDLTRVFQDLTTFEYPFEQTEDGPWLWVPVPGSAEFWAVPADAAFFGMGAAPTLLDRLFDGMKNASAGFRFRLIYKPCRLRPVGGRPNLYSLVEKGALQLEGSPQPDTARPPDYDSLLRGVKPQSISFRGGRSVGRLLADWVTTISSQVAEQSNAVAQLPATIRQLEQGARQATRNDPRPPAISVSGVKPEDLTRTLEALERRIGERLDGITKQQQALASKVAELGRTTDQKSKAGDSATIETPERNSQNEKALPLTNAVAATGRGSGVMPNGWQGAIEKAARQPDSEPEVTEVPREALYVQRVMNAAKTLSGLDSETRVSVVHLKKHPVDETFEIHETEPTTVKTSELRCRSCNTPQTWQLAVCVGPRGFGDVSVIFPQGHFGKGNYASGYVALIDDLPSSSFSIGRIEQPARLELLDAKSGVYTVKRRMVCSRLSTEASN
jgi:hypothetical protein